jgi:hypothetical protein
MCGNIKSQVTTSSNTSLPGGQYVGFSGFGPGGPKPLDIRNQYAGEQIRFFTGGAAPAFQRMYINGSVGATAGFVGINIMAALQRLHVAGDINNQTVLQVKNANNLFVGWGAGNSWVSLGVAENTFVGNNSGFSNTTGFHNTFLGFESGRMNVDGEDNTFLGYFSGRVNVGGAGGSKSLRSKC